MSPEDPIGNVLRRYWIYLRVRSSSNTSTNLRQRGTYMY